MIPQIKKNFKRYRETPPSKRYALALKEIVTLPRRGWLLKGIEDPETVGEHLQFVLFHTEREAPPFIDLSKAKEMAKLHDLSEAIITDITPYDPISKEEKRKLEIEALHLLFETSPQKEEMLSLFSEYLESTSKESLWVHDVDSLDPLFVALQYEARYLEKQNLFEEFLNSAERSIKTERGKELLQFVKEKSDSIRSEYKKMNLKRRTVWY